MRIWSLHPKYLDAKGLVALWRETLLAKHVLEGKTKGYKNHPQLNRFKTSPNPLEAINYYLSEVYSEALKRDYNFDRNKIVWTFSKIKMPVTKGQIRYETDHLLKKLESRDPDMYLLLRANKVLETHPLFETIEGDIEEWEIQN